MSVTLVLADDITTDLSEKAVLPNESGGVLLARTHHASNGDVRLLGRSLHWVSPEAYRLRSSTEMLITPEGYVQALGLAERDGAIPIWLHTHPNGCPLPSVRDQKVDDAIAEVFRIRSGSAFYGTVIISMDGASLGFTGTLQEIGGKTIPIDRFWLVGDRWRLQKAFAQESDFVDLRVFDRNVRAFGEAVQRTIGALKIAVVGVGGTGSAVAEQLVRLGARDLLLIDADVLSESNVTRVYGSTVERVGTPKAELVADHIAAIAPDTRREVIIGRCVQEPVARVLANVDIVFGCTDDNAGRLVLSRLSTYYFVPVIDLGVLLSSDTQDILTGIDGRITVLSPGNACLVCRNRIDTARAASEMLTPSRRSRLVDEGYAPALGGAEPAVITYTTMVAAAAINELLERLIGYGHAERPSEILLRLHDREVSVNVAEPRPRHYCHPGQGKWGIGDTEPFLNQIWVSEQEGAC